MDKKIISAALKNNGHYIDIAANELYVTAAFNKKASIYGTAECIRMNAILAMFPTMQVKVHTTSRKNDALSYKMMEDYICIMPGASDNFAEYKRIKQMSHAYRSAYKFVAEWFAQKFPHYSELLAKDETGNLVWDAVAMYQAAEKENEKKNAAPAVEAAETPASAKEVVEAPKLALLESA